MNNSSVNEEENKICQQSIPIHPGQNCQNNFVAHSNKKTKDDRIPIEKSRNDNTEVLLKEAK